MYIVNLVEGVALSEEVGETRTNLVWLLGIVSLVLYATLFFTHYLSRIQSKQSLRDAVLYTPITPAGHDQALRIAGSFSRLKLPLKVVAYNGEISLRTRSGNFDGYDSISTMLIGRMIADEKVVGALLMTGLCFLFLVARLSLPSPVFGPISLASPFVVPALSIPLVGTCEGCTTSAGPFAQAVPWGLILLPLALAYPLWVSPTWRARMTRSAVLALVLVLQCILLLIFTPHNYTINGCITLQR